MITVTAALGRITRRSSKMLRCAGRCWASRELLRRVGGSVGTARDLQRRPFSALNYVEEMRSSWKTDPSSVHATWNEFFSKEQSTESTPSVSTVSTDHELIQKAASDHIRMLLLVRSYQVRSGSRRSLLGFAFALSSVIKFDFAGQRSLHVQVGSPRHQRREFACG